MLLDFEDEGMLCDLFHVLFESIKCDGSHAHSLLSLPLRLGHVAQVLICLSAISNPGTNVTQPGKRGAGEDANAGGNL